ncbi:MAG: hypothetical protein V4623_00095 [Pseudomonadota bacterium]
MQLKPIHFESLPANFSFPNDYLTFLQTQPLPELSPWSFLLTEQQPGAREEIAQTYYDALRERCPERHLVPFAIAQETSGVYNDGFVVVACFDAKAEEPVVFIYDYAAEAEQTLAQPEHQSFSAWLEAAQAESTAYQSHASQAAS